MSGFEPTFVDVLKVMFTQSCVRTRCISAEPVYFCDAWYSDVFVVLSPGFAVGAVLPEKTTRVDR